MKNFPILFNNYIQIVLIKITNHFRLYYNYLKLIFSYDENRKSDFIKRINRLNLSIRPFKYKTFQNLKQIDSKTIYKSKKVRILMLETTTDIEIASTKIFQISDCKLVIGTNTLILNDEIYFDDKFSYLISQRYQIDPILKINKDFVYLGFLKNPIVKIEKIIYIDTFFIWNYYHFIFDTLAKLEYVNENLMYLDYSIAIGQEILKSPNLYLILKKYSKDRKILLLEKHQSYSCKECIFIEKSNYLPPDIGRKGTFLTPEIYAIHPETIEFLRSSLQIHFPTREKNVFSKHIIISRLNNGNTRIDEDIWFNDLINGYNFVTYYPEKMDLRDQITLFKNAEFVIASTGAALVNILFMQKGSIVASINGESSGFSQYRNIATHLGINFYEPKSVPELIKLAIKYKSNCNFN